MNLIKTLLSLFSFCILSCITIPNGTLWSLSETLNPAAVSHLTSISVTSGSVKVFDDLAKYGSSVGGARFDHSTGFWYAVYGFQKNNYCHLVKMKLPQTGKQYKTNITASALMSYCPWNIIIYKKQIYGVIYNDNQNMQQIVQINEKTGDLTVICDLPPKFGNKFGRSNLGDIDYLTGTYYVVLDGKYYYSQYLFAVSLANATFTEFTINNEDTEWIIPSLTFSTLTNNLIGAGFQVNTGQWFLISIDKLTGSINTIGNNFADSSSDYIWQYNIIYLFNQYYFLLSSNKDQDVWYIATLNTNSGQIEWFSELNGSNLPKGTDIPNHLVFYN